MIIRKARLKDASAIAQVHVDSWQTTYRGILPNDYIQKQSYKKRENSWKKGLVLSTQENTDYFVFVAENSAGKIIGFIDGGLFRNNSIHKGEIYALYILDAYQRQGIGRKLVQKIAFQFNRLDLNSILVWVLADNPATKFYQALGGKQVAQKTVDLNGIKFEEIAYEWAMPTLQS